MFADLTKWISDATVPFPGDTPTRLTTDTTVERDGFATRTLTLASHIGTHCDAPAHVLANGRRLDDYPLERFIGPACLVPLSGITARTPISVEMLALFEALFQPNGRVLLKTDWEQTAVTLGADFFRDAPFLTLEAAQWIAQHRIGLLGFDLPSVDPFCTEASNATLACHVALLSADVLLLENLTGLEPLATVNAQSPAGSISPAFRLLALPLKVQNAEGAPVRAIAEWNR